MGIISDAIDALEDWCKDLFKDGIQSQFDGISDLLTDTFSQTTGTGGSGGLVNDFVTQHPSQFTGGGTGGTGDGSGTGTGAGAGSTQNGPDQPSGTRVDVEPNTEHFVEDIEAQTRG